MGCRCIVSTIGYATSCCSKIKNVSYSMFFKRNDSFELYKQDIDMKDDGHHSNIMSKEEINLMIEKNQQSSSNILNEYKIIKNSNESDDEDNSLGNVNQIKQEVNTIEFDDKDECNNQSELKQSEDTNETIESLKKEIMMTTPEGDIE